MPAIAASMKATCAASPSAAGMTASPASTTGPTMRAFATVPRPGRSPSGIQRASSTTDTIKVVWPRLRSIWRARPWVNTFQVEPEIGLDERREREAEQHESDEQPDRPLDGPIPRAGHADNLAAVVRTKRFDRVLAIMQSG